MYRQLFKTILAFCILYLSPGVLAETYFTVPIKYNIRPTGYPVGIAMQFQNIHSADFDNDGDPDLVVSYLDGIIYLENIGSGVFSKPSLIYENTGKGLTTADFNMDGFVDLASSPWDYTIAIFLGNGDGTFQDPGYYVSLGNNLRKEITSADLDGDGDTDVVTANEFQDNISIFLNAGDGTFVVANNYRVGKTPKYVVPSDYDNDGDIDLAVTNMFSGNVSILLNNSDGTFQPAANYETDDFPRSIVSVDIDGDGDFDLATANVNAYQEVSILINNGDGTFTSPVDYNAADSPFSIFAADYDNDGDFDLATAGPGISNVSVLINDGFGIFDTEPSIKTDDDPIAICSADFDGDGDFDLVTASSTENNITVLFNLHNYVCGDINRIPGLNILDVVHLINFIYKEGDPPVPMEAAEIDGIPQLDILDAVHLINYIYNDGSDPVCP